MVIAAMKLKDAYSLEEKLWTNLDSIFKSRDITLLTKVHLVKAMVLQVVMYGCESWTVKKAEHRRMMLLNCGVGEDSWESLGLQGDPTSPFWRRSALGFLWKEWCWSWNSSTLATSCEELTHWKRFWCWEGLGAGGEGDDRGWVGWMASLTRWTWVSELRELVMDRDLWRDAIHGVARSRTWLSDWTELNWVVCVAHSISSFQSLLKFHVLSKDFPDYHV